MLCVLFRSCLILAVPDSDVRQYQIVVCVGLRDFRVESTENGKGSNSSDCDVAPSKRKQVCSAILRFIHGRSSSNSISDSSR